MKKKKLNFKDLDLLSNHDHVGFIDDSGAKGYVAYLGDGVFKPISMESHSSVCNRTYGSSVFNNVRDALRIDEVSGALLEEVFLFKDRKSLYEWLSK